jgi:hypothetical protein
MEISTTPLRFSHQTRFHITAPAVKYRNDPARPCSPISSQGLSCGGDHIPHGFQGNTQRIGGMSKINDGDEILPEIDTLHTTRHAMQGCDSLADMLWRNIQGAYCHSNRGQDIGNIKIPYQG